MNGLSEHVAVIGCGVMGTGISRRLLACGLRVFVRDPDSAKVQALVDAGATGIGSAAEATRAATFVITSLNSAAIVEAVVFGDDGIAAGGGPDRLLIDMSSIDPKATAEMADRLRAEVGMAWVDAPLSGGAPAVAEGRLTLMLGGGADDVARASVILRELATNITHMGPTGAGQTTKLVNQILCACNFLSVAEATRFALDGGVDPVRIPGALAGGRADSRILQEFMAKMAAYDYTPTGRIDNMLKDLESAQQAAFASRTPMPLTGLVTELHRMMIQAGLGGDDSAAYMKLFDFGQGPSGGA